MKTSKILRLASIAATAQYCAHTFLFLSKEPSHGPEEIAVVETMKSHAFEFGRFKRSYWDFYFGYGLMAILTGVIEVGLLWQLATLAKTDARRIRSVIALALFAVLGHTFIVWRFFFLAPVVGDLAVAACICWALVVSGHDEGPDPAVQVTVMRPSGA